MFMHCLTNAFKAWNVNLVELFSDLETGIPLKSDIGNSLCRDAFHISRAYAE